MTDGKSAEIKVSMIVRHNLFDDPVLDTICPSVRVVVQCQSGLSDFHTLSHKSEGVSQIPVLDAHNSPTKASDLVKVALNPRARICRWHKQ